jgi:hypothetical protein
MGKRLRVLIILLVALLALAALAAARLYYWGRPVPLAFEPLGPGEWQAPDGKTVELKDTDGDGTWDVLEAEGRTVPLHGGAQRARLLIVCLDGVPYAELRALWDEGHFRDFYRPVEMVSTFPSDTEPALTTILQAASTTGYENRFFQRKQGKIVGGMTVTLAQSAPYLKKLDYDEPAPFKGLQYFAATRSYRADLGRLRQRFLASSKALFIAHIASSDGLYHVAPAARLRPLLLEADTLLRDLFLAASGKLEIVLFSDHGNDLTPAKPAPLRAALEQAGYSWSNTLDHPRDVAVPQFGLVSFAAVYAQPADVSGVAEVLAKTEGVDLVAYRNGGPPRVRSGDAVATIEADKEFSRFRYLAERGDPLDLLPVLDRLRSQGRVDASGFAAEQDLFAATVGARYPDALYRILDWASESRSPISNRSDLMVSLKDGYYSGSGFFEGLVKIESTHGSLSRGASLGFAMATDRPLPGAQRYDQFLVPYLK